MSQISKISLSIFALGILIGLFTGGPSGMLMGFIISGAVAFGVFCVANTIKANSAPVEGGPFDEIPPQTRPDRTQLPKGAYQPHDSGLI